MAERQRPGESQAAADAAPAIDWSVDGDVGVGYGDGGLGDTVVRIPKLGPNGHPVQPTSSSSSGAAAAAAAAGAQCARPASVRPISGLRISDSMSIRINMREVSPSFSVAMPVM